MVQEGLFQKYFLFNGRLPLLQLLIRSILLGIASGAVSVLLFVIGSSLIGKTAILLLLPIAVLGWFSSLSLQVRRLHDLGLSGWWLLAFGLVGVLAQMARGLGTPAELAVALVGFAGWLFISFYPGNAAVNRFGPPA